MVAKLTETIQTDANGEIDLKIDPRLKQLIDMHIYVTFFQGEDFVLLLTGKEGTGKSVLARQIGAYVNHKIRGWGGNTTFDINNIHFRLKPYLDAAKENHNKKGWVNLLDEARASANRKRSNSTINLKFTNYLSICRFNHHVHIICLPAYHDLDSSLAIWRTHLMIKCEKAFVKDENSEVGYSLRRGRFKIFKNNRAYMNMYFHKTLRYMYPKQPFIPDGNFDNIEILSKKEEDIYEKKKLDALYEDEKDNESKSKRAENTKKKLVKAVAKIYNDGLKQREIALLLGCSQQSINKYLAEYAQMREEREEELR